MQIRTLLQHAHSELTHDTLYKPKTTANSSVKRTVAKSMALIETTDEFFAQAMKDLDLADESHKELLKYLTKAYQDGTNLLAEQERSNQLVIDAFIELLPSNWDVEIRTFFDKNKYILQKIREHIGRRHFFNQPAVLLAYYLTSTMPAQTKEHWPIDSTDLEKIFIDLGMKYEN
ncbi:hypothetical protein [Verminephrobacter eiseniae]|uniref:hypothetical protein n=1 Tax=Verminephrobacter eiseniae TaxID=364317 RepID=UPI002AA2A67F|nr:hypothetical protein [Verminephrobacter eiseniae]